MSRFVLDCSAALSWCFRDEATPQTEALFQRLASDTAIVPALWHVEFANALYQAERRQRISAEDVDHWMRLAERLGIETDGNAATQPMPQALKLARQWALTVYDAMYLELALRHAAPLATRDTALAHAAKGCSVLLLL